MGAVLSKGGIPDEVPSPADDDHDGSARAARGVARPPRPVTASRGQADGSGADCASRRWHGAVGHNPSGRCSGLPALRRQRHAGAEGPVGQIGLCRQRKGDRHRSSGSHRQPGSRNPGDRRGRPQRPQASGGEAARRAAQSPPRPEGGRSADLRHPERPQPAVRVAPRLVGRRGAPDVEPVGRGAGPYPRREGPAPRHRAAERRCGSLGEAIGRHLARGPGDASVAPAPAPVDDVGRRPAGLRRDLRRRASGSGVAATDVGLSGRSSRCHRGRGRRRRGRNLQEGQAVPAGGWRRMRF